MRTKPILVVGLLAIAVGCYSVPTPSGRPELRVRLSAKEVKARIVNEWSMSGWLVQHTDELGVNLVRPLSDTQTVLVGAGAMQVRVNIMETGGACQVRATCFTTAGGYTTDVSGDRLGYDIQCWLERMFAAESLDGPYILEPATPSG